MRSQMQLMNQLCAWPWGLLISNCLHSDQAHPHQDCISSTFYNNQVGILWRMNLDHSKHWEYLVHWLRFCLNSLLPEWEHLLVLNNFDPTNVASQSTIANQYNFDLNAYFPLCSMTSKRFFEVNNNVFHLATSYVELLCNNKLNTLQNIWHIICIIP